MAKLPSIPFHHKNETGETLEFTSSVTLDQDGTFNVSIPDELYETARALCEKIEHRASAWMTKPPTAKQHRVSGSRLDDVKRFIKAAMADHLKCEVTTERVIVYGHSLKVSYSKAVDGSVHANGYIARAATGARGDEGYGKHCGELNATAHAPLYSVGLGAKVFDRVTYIRASGKKVEYKRPEFPGSHFNHDSPGKLLNAFAGLGIDPGRSGTEEMPYSDEAALFFYDAMIAMCKLAEQVKAFLGDRKTLMLAIEKRANLLPAPQAREEHHANAT